MAKGSKKDDKTDAAEETAPEVAEAPLAPPTPSSTAKPDDGLSDRERLYYKVQGIGTRFQRLGARLVAEPFSEEEPGKDSVPNVALLAELKSLADTVGDL